MSAGREQGAVSPDDLVELVRAFRRAAPATTPSLALSDSPLFQHRLLLDRLAVTGPRPLPLRGVVSIRWRTGGDDWSEPMRVVAASSPAPTDPD
ncbi:MAG: hypothetical protein DWQ30_24990 [Acidobacteria bacterium]|nr:MAG: hypothetical protein DWQ30_24990 [Acidobacteriota bacterium]